MCDHLRHPNINIEFGTMDYGLVDLSNGDNSCVQLPSAWFSCAGLKINGSLKKSQNSSISSTASSNPQKSPSSPQQSTPTKYMTTNAVAEKNKEINCGDVDTLSENSSAQKVDQLTNGVVLPSTGDKTIESKQSPRTTSSSATTTATETVEEKDSCQIPEQPTADPKKQPKDITTAEKPVVASAAAPVAQQKSCELPKSLPVKIKVLPPKPLTSWAGLFKSNTSVNPSVNAGTAAAARAQKPVVKNNVVKTKLACPATNGSSAVLPNAFDFPSLSNKSAPETGASAASSAPSSNNNHIVETKDDYAALEIAEKLASLDLIYKPQGFVPRGLTNTNNSCFMNATLQALLVCPPLYQLLKSLPLVSEDKRPNSSTPVLDSFVELASNFRQLSLRKGNPPLKEVPQDPAFEPHCIYNMLSDTNPTLFEKGVQGDAQEFLNVVLNGLHEEIRKLDLYREDYENNGPSAVIHNGLNNGGGNLTPAECGSDYAEENGDDWEEVTKKNRSNITRPADNTKSHISEIFRGVLSYSLLYRQGAKPRIIHDNFFCLPINVQAHRTVEEALASLTVKEQLNDGGDNKAANSRHQTIETLPPVLILNLKRFVYQNGKTVKLDQELDFKTDLTIDKEILSKNTKKLRLAKRSYKLFAVVNHHGDSPDSGHYSTDVFHIGLSRWLRMDDTSIRSVRNIEVTKHNKTRSAYLLFYRRTDLG